MPPVHCACCAWEQEAGRDCRHAPSSAGAPRRRSPCSRRRSPTPHSEGPCTAVSSSCGPRSSP
eukprot:10701205-Alexandrium_andersonii.AAC.1